MDTLDVVEKHMAIERRTAMQAESFVVVRTSLLWIANLSFLVGDGLLIYVWALWKTSQLPLPPMLQDLPISVLFFATACALAAYLFTHILVSRAYSRARRTLPVRETSVSDDDGPNPLLDESPGDVDYDVKYGFWR